MTISFTLPAEIPDRPDNQDEIIAVLVLRRVDPGNPDGSATGDLPKPFDPENVALVRGLLAAVDGSVFDPALSYVTNVSATDVDASGAITLAELATIFPPEADPEPAPEG